MEATLDVLRRVPIFGALADETLRFLYGRAEPVARFAGEVFFSEGDIGDALYVLEKGRAEVCKTRGERSVVLSSVEEGDCFGEIALVAICPRSASVRAVTDCRAARLPNGVLLELYEADLEQFTLLQMNLGREIARRLNDTSDLLFERQDSETEVPTALSGRLGQALK